MYFKPKKRLGQNFLIDKNIQRKLVAMYALKPSDCVLEIGAGYGDLTRLIARSTAFVYALEIDHNLCRILKENTRGYTNIKIINQDILKFNLGRYFRGLNQKLKVVGNIPYYITTPIIERLLKYPDNIEYIFITVQKEFAKRITACAGSKDYGSFSCFVQYHCLPKIHFLIRKTSFSPIPKVDSCLIGLKVLRAPAVEVKDENLFFRIIRLAFNQRRKTLRNSLRGIIPLEKLTSLFQTHNINPNTRPEDLTLKDFAYLANL